MSKVQAALNVLEREGIEAEEKYKNGMTSPFLPIRLAHAREYRATLDLHIETLERAIKEEAAK